MTATGKAGLRGGTPEVTIQKAPPMTPEVRRKKEKAKYEKMWGRFGEQYRKVCPGELAASTFMQVATPERGDSIIDFGCGTGNSIWWISLVKGLEMTLLDFASNCLDDTVLEALENHGDRLSFMEHNLNDPSPVTAQYGYCTDVMEHIPPEEVDNVLYNILKGAQCVFFRISTQPDVLGPACLQQPLHLSVHDYAWWTAKFREHGCKIIHSEDLGGAVDFYVTNWQGVLPDMEVNTSTDQRVKHIITNAKLEANRIQHCEPQDTPVMLLCGGPSLNDFEDEILENYQQGMKVVTMNGSYQWAMDRGITRVNQCMLDSRPFNARFVEPPSDECFYFIASQCHPSVFESLPMERTFMWHVTNEESAVEAIDKFYPEGYIICGGGSTVATRVIVLMNLLGFSKQVIYGMDSCLTGEDHHAYDQEENDQNALVKVMIEGRTFDCHPWMAQQASDFAKLNQWTDGHFDLDIKGDGLIAWIHKTGAVPPELN